MRLWHKDLIPVLPRQQLLSQWRECCAIANSIATKGTPNHILVNEILNYPMIHFVAYVDLVLNEMHERGYKVSEKSYTTLCKNLERGIDHFKVNFELSLIRDSGDVFMNWHNDRYLKQCFYNLQEKYDRGGIPDREWQKIKDGLTL